jgi:hypothetical protein
MLLPADGCGLAETARVLGYLARAERGPCRCGLPAVARDFADLAWQPRASRGNRLWEKIGLLPGPGALKHLDGTARLAASADEARRHRTRGPCAAARASDAAAVPVAAGVPGPGVEWQ